MRASSGPADVIRDWLEERLNIANISGDEIRLRECLFCGKPRTMKVNVERRKFYCHHQDCGRAGGLVQLIQAVEGVDYDEAIGIARSLTRGLLHGHRKLSDVRKTLRRVRATESTEESASEIRHELPDEFIPCFDETRSKPWRVPSYLTRPQDEGGRGLTREMIARWGIGYATEGRCEGRVIIPIRCGRLQSWVARAIDPDLRPKYLTAHSAQDPGADRLMFGYDAVTPEVDTLVALEGTFDAIRLWSYGIEAVAYLKDGISAGQVTLLGRLAPRRLVLLPDGGDPKAWERSLTAAAALGSRFEQVAVARLVPPRGQKKIDPDTAPRSMIEDAIADAISVDRTASIRAKRERLRSPWSL